MKKFRNAIGSEQVSAWYPGGTAPEQWASSGKNITKFIDSGNYDAKGGGYNKWLYSNTLGWKAGDDIQISINANIISGGSPRLRINNKSYRPIYEKTLLKGQNTIAFKVPVDFLDRLYIYNQYQSAMNFNMAVSSAKLTPDAVVQNQANPVQTVVSAATILKDEASKSTITTQDGKVIGATTPGITPDQPVVQGFSMKKAVIYVGGAILALFILRKVLKKLK